LAKFALEFNEDCRACKKHLIDTMVIECEITRVLFSIYGENQEISGAEFAAIGLPSLVCARTMIDKNIQVFLEQLLRVGKPQERGESRTDFDIEQ